MGTKERALSLNKTKGIKEQRRREGAEHFVDMKDETSHFMRECELKSQCA